MKFLKETYVIIERFGGHYQYFNDESFVSFNKKELEAKCNQINKKEYKELKEKIDKQNKKKKEKYILPHIDDIKRFAVVDLQTAIEEIKDIVYEYYRPQSEDD